MEVSRWVLESWVERVSLAVCKMKPVDYCWTGTYVISLLVLGVFCFGLGYTQSVQLSENFRTLTDPGGVCYKGIILQGGQLPSGLPLIGQSFLRIKWYITGVSIHSPRQRNSIYVQTTRLSIYEIRWTKHPHLPILGHVQRPPGTWSSSPLHDSNSVPLSCYYSLSCSLSCSLHPSLPTPPPAVSDVKI